MYNILQHLTKSYTPKFHPRLSPMSSWAKRRPSDGSFNVHMAIIAAISLPRSAREPLSLDLGPVDLYPHTEREREKEGERNIYICINVLYIYTRLYGIHIHSMYTKLTR